MRVIVAVFKQRGSLLFKIPTITPTITLLESGVLPKQNHNVCSCGGVIVGLWATTGLLATRGDKILLPTAGMPASFLRFLCHCTSDLP